MITMLLLMSATLTEPSNMVALPKGNYRPLYMSKTSPQTKVDAFSIDVTPVTNQQYLTFVLTNPRWQPNSIPQIFAEPQYLQHWQPIADQKTSEFNDENKLVTLPSADQMNSPVTNVSWFAAQAYCKAQNKRLPTVAEWERVASASETQENGSLEKDYHARILEWYSRPNSKFLPEVGLTSANYWGVKDLHGLIWEWTEDFNSALVSGESRSDSNINQKLFCAAGAQGAADPSDYAAFMRFGFRSSLQAKFTLPNLGFRCAKTYATTYATTQDQTND
ncbi:formylglycine-generating enzyme family protein [Psychrosphaera sp. 1_MG-2023]|nr:formylglycine-generating enzyme family protein [Psychrosphaera sp. 1_MG-2023]MDO6721501.1 formylglycine-generating enzyme family protein [Psychrosphaera sp. 1_MG-2023]